MSRYPRYRDPVRMPRYTRVPVIVTYRHTVASALRLSPKIALHPSSAPLLFVLTCDYDGVAAWSHFILHSSTHLSSSVAALSKV